MWRPFTAAGGGSYDPHGQHKAGRPFTVLDEQFNRSSKVLSRDYAGYIFALRALPRSKGGLFDAPGGKANVIESEKYA